MTTVSKPLTPLRLFGNIYPARDHGCRVIGFSYPYTPRKSGDPAIDNELDTERPIVVLDAADFDALFVIAQAYRNYLRTAAHTEGEVATFHHIEATLAKTATP
jgi:hypothetical protein